MKKWFAVLLASLLMIGLAQISFAGEAPDPVALKSLLAEEFYV